MEGGSVKKAKKKLFGGGAADGDAPGSVATKDGTGHKGTEHSPSGSARSVESMLQEFSADSEPQQSGAARRAGKYDQLWQLSMADPHTGLANQLLLLDRLSQAMARRKRHGGEVVVCHIDLDNLGDINLELGYTTGNTVLCEVSRRLTGVLRSEDTVGRVGGSELVAVMTINDEQAVGPLTRRLQHTLDEAVMVGGRSVQLRSTLGVAVAADTEAPEELLARADRSAAGGSGGVGSGVVGH
jgi:diguanylate cyclase (GGDEF)-like protein